MRILNIVIFLFVAVAMTLCSSEAFPADPIKVTLESVKDEYVIKEPVRFKVTLTNVSVFEQRIMPVDKWYMTLKRYMSTMNVTTPDGKKELRQIPYMEVNWLRGGGVSHYKGEPLAPGESIVTYIYTSITILRGDVTREEILENKERRKLTFHEPGVYKVSIVYKTSPLNVKIFCKKGGLHSNDIYIKFRKPTPVEEEILDSCRNNTQALNGYRFKVSRVGRMPELIEKYPDQPLIRYLEFLMGVAKYTAHQYGEAAKYFNAFSRKYPDFRFFETQVAIGRSYLGMGEKEKAVALVDSTLTVDPSLKDVPDIMKIKAEALHGRQGYHKWLRAREKGIDIFDKKTPVTKEN